MQSKLSSLTETALNTLSGFVLSIITSYVIFPLYGVHIPASSNFGIVATFTVVSIVRGYFWRRYFNRRLIKKAEQL